MLLRTSKDSGHNHIAYQREDRTGSTSVHNNHFHDILTEVVDPTEGMTEEERNEFFDLPEELRPSETTRIFLTPAGKDQHTHELTDDFIFAEEENIEEDKKTDEETIVEGRGLWKFARDHEKDFRDSGYESEDVFRGKQWDDKEKKKLEKEQRAALTINETAGKIDQLSGFHRQNRLDIKFFPIGDGDGKTADMVTAIVKNILNINDFIHEENQVFEDKLISGRGLYDCFMDYDRNLLGDLMVKRRPWDAVWLGPHENYDLSDCEYDAKSEWYSFARLSEMYPDKKGDLTKDLNAQFQNESKKEDPLKENKGQEYELATDVLPLQHTTDFFNRTRKDYRVLEINLKIYKRVFVLVHARDDFYFNAEGVNMADIKAAETIEGFRSIPRVKTHIRTIIFAGAVMLDESIDEDEDSLSIVPDYAKKRGKHVWGKVEAAKDAQKEINKRISQSIDIVNKAAGYGWFYDGETFESPKDENNFKSSAGKPGFKLKLRDTNRPPSKVEGSKIPVEIVQMQILARESLERVMNSPPELQGRSQRIESGAALRERKAAGLIGNEFLFDNSSIAKRTLGRKILKMIQKHYSVQRLQRLLSDQAIRDETTGEGLKIGDKPFTKFSDEEIFEMLNNADLTQYDVQVAESAYNETNRRANFFSWAEMAKVIPGIPPTMLVGLSDLPDKAAALKAMVEAEQQRQKELEDKNQTEIAKTAIARGGGQGEGE